MTESIIQDTLTLRINQGRDTATHTVSANKLQNSARSDSAKHFQIVLPVIKKAWEQDTSTSCSRNPVADINYSDSSNVIFTVRQDILKEFPFVFTSINKEMDERSRAAITSHLKPGAALPEHVFQNDWFLPFLLFAILVYGLIRGELLKLFKDLGKFFFFRGIKELASKERGSHFQWQATLFNLSAFINISIFVLLSAIWLDIVPSYVNQARYSAISFIVVVSAVTARHIICLIVGNISEEQVVFGEYLYWIYQAYRVASMILLVLSIFILYTNILPANLLFYAGFVVVAGLYLLRISRLSLIFISRHISILYLILYLCALEILPVAVIVKYAAKIL